MPFFLLIYGLMDITMNRQWKACEDFISVKRLTEDDVKKLEKDN